MELNRSSKLTGLSVGQATVGQALETFLRLGLVGKSPHTVDWYRKRLGGLAAALGVERPATGVMEMDLLDWYVQEQRRATRWGGKSTHPQAKGGLSPAYLHSLVRAAKVFFKWLEEKGIVGASPARELVFPRLPRQGRKGIADGDVQKILALARRGDDPLLRARDYALLRFLESTGARLGGIAGLLMDDLFVCEPDRKAVVREKFAEERPVYMTPSAVQAMRAWLALRPACADEHVFLGRKNGGGWSGLTEGGIYEILKRYAREAGVKKNWSPHQWRHRFGRLLAKNGMSIGIIAQIMGHKNVGVTDRFYGQFADDERQREYDLHMPDVG